jgi:hypothetical protein
MDQPVNFVCIPIGRALGIVDILVVLGAKMGVVVVGHQAGEGPRSLHDTFGMLVEELKKLPSLGSNLPNSMETPPLHRDKTVKKQ